MTIIMHLPICLSFVHFEFAFSENEHVLDLSTLQLTRTPISKSCRRSDTQLEDLENSPGTSNVEEALTRQESTEGTSRCDHKSIKRIFFKMLPSFCNVIMQQSFILAQTPEICKNIIKLKTFSNHTWELVETSFWSRSSVVGSSFSSPSKETNVETSSTIPPAIQLMWRSQSSWLHLMDSTYGRVLQGGR